MQLKLLFSLINFMSTILLVFVAFRIKSEKDYIKSIRSLLLSAAAAVSSNILIANSTGISFANLSYCFYFTQLDWLSYFLCVFSLEYTEHKTLLKKINPFAVTICLLDTIFLYTNLIHPYIYSVYTKLGADGTIYYQTSLNPVYNIHLALDYSLIFIGLVTLSVSLYHSYGFYRKKYSSIIFVVGLIIVLNIIYMMFSLPLDFSVLFYVIAGILIHYYATMFIPKHIKNQALGFVVNYMNEGLILFDKDYNCIYSNTMVEEQFGLQVSNITIDTPILKEIAADHNLSSEKTFSTLYQTEIEDMQYSYKVHFRNIFDDKMRNLGSFYIFENVTEEYVAYSKMKEAQEIADRANKTKSLFLANMSHEIRTPINSVLGMNEMILRESKNEQIIDYAQNIDSAGTTLLMLINDILDFSKIEAGKFELVNTTYSFQQLMHDCYVMLLPRAEGKHLNFKVSLNENIPCKLFGDKNRILQILINIVSNAIKYTPQGNVTVNADYESITDNRIQLTIKVSDTGIGISQENIHKLFDAFVRVDQEKNKNIEGTGLGLAIAKQLSEMMDGTILVESELNKGSTFTILLTQQVEDSAPGGPLPVKNVSEKPITEGAFVAPQAKILVVDDVKVNLKVVSALLKRTKVQIDTAESGEEAIAFCEKNKYDIILMDHMMPGMDGIEAFHAIRNGNGINRNTIQIVLTANAINGASEEYTAEGFEDYLSKPVKGIDLEQMLLKYLPKEYIEAI